MGAQRALRSACVVRVEQVTKSLRSQPISAGRWCVVRVLPMDLDAAPSTTSTLEFAGVGGLDHVGPCHYAKELRPLVYDEQQVVAFPLSNVPQVSCISHEFFSFSAERLHRICPLNHCIHLRCDLLSNQRLFDSRTQVAIRQLPEHVEVWFSFFLTHWGDRIFYCLQL